ncbi:MAG: right-handed parallel beta-helix repeat-containing protein [Bacteroidales bacterium]|nr:right-handed parallel beta-helix repeat-containing protein [Bacteroidales bacterium]
MLRRFPNIILFSVSLFLICFCFSCRKKDKIDTSPDIQLSFSTDTVFFDTVFTTVGSITKRLIVYNQRQDKVSISHIRLMGGENSNYRINVDGEPGIDLTDLEIAGDDSLFIFIRVTINPNNQNTPFIVNDSLEFQINGNIQRVQLVSWGQDAFFYRNATLSGNVLWDSLKPHVIYGALRIDTNAMLTILPGTKIYFHQNAYLSASFRSTLKVIGTQDHPVRFQGDRLDYFYRDLPGQWIGILLEAGSLNHQINYAIIKNGVYGIAIDIPESQTNPMLVLDNTIIRNMTGDGIYAYGTTITSTNCVIGNCGGNAVDIIYGGSYDFRQLTIGNFWSSSVRLSPSVYISNYTVDTTGQKFPNPLVSAYFGNAILYGSNDEEIMLDSVTSAPFAYTFDHALLKTRLNTSASGRFIQCMVNQDPRFMDGSKMDYRIDSLSPAIKKGIQMGVLYDILGIERGPTPDLGAYQYQSGTRN